MKPQRPPTIAVTLNEIEFQHLTKFRELMKHGYGTLTTKAHQYRVVGMPLTLDDSPDVLQGLQETASKGALQMTGT